MIQEDWKKRYSFRLSDDDEEVGKFLQRSKKSNSETIRKLLKFAINELQKERENRENNNFHLDIKKALQEIKHLQENNHEEIISKLNERIVVNKSYEEENTLKNEETVDKSIKNSIDSMINFFDTDD